MALNGHNVGVAISNSSKLDPFVDIGGVTENSFTLNNTPIEIQSKTTGAWRKILNDKGLQSVDMNVTCVFNSDLGLRRLRNAAKEKENKYRFQIDRGGVLMEGEFYVQNYAESSPDNDKVTATFSLVSSGTVTGI